MTAGGMLYLAARRGIAWQSPRESGDVPQGGRRRVRRGPRQVKNRESADARGFGDLDPLAMGAQPVSNASDHVRLFRLLPQAFEKALR